MLGFRVSGRFGIMKPTQNPLPWTVELKVVRVRDWGFGVTSET